jgi:hypothetical protein
LPDLLESLDPTSVRHESTSAMDTAWYLSLHDGYTDARSQSELNLEFSELGRFAVPDGGERFQISEDVSCLQHQDDVFGGDPAFLPSVTAFEGCRTSLDVRDGLYEPLHLCRNSWATPRAATRRIDPSMASCKSYEVASIMNMLPCPQCDRAFKTTAVLK